jgi:hypothetical protein
MSFLVWRFRRKSIVNQHLHNRIAVGAATIRTYYVTFHPILPSPHETPGSNSSPEVTPFTLAKPSTPWPVTQNVSYQNISKDGDAARPVMPRYPPSSGYTIGTSSKKARLHSKSNLSSLHGSSQGLHPDPQTHGMELAHPRYDDGQDVLVDFPPSYQIDSPLVENREGD